MFITVHAAAAVIIGKKVHNTPLAFLLALISHFILDIIPHGDKEMGDRFMGFKLNLKFFKKRSFKTMILYGFMDLSFLIIFILYLFSNFHFKNPNSVTWAIFGSIIPDILAMLYLVGGFKPLKKFYNWHDKIHYFIIKKIGTDLPLMYGILLQFILLISFFWIIYAV